MDLPQSVCRIFKGMIGQPHGGFPEKLQKIVGLKGEKPITHRPGELLEPVDFVASKALCRKNSATRSATKTIRLLVSCRVRGFPTPPPGIYRHLGTADSCFLLWSRPDGRGFDPDRPGENDGGQADGRRLSRKGGCGPSIRTERRTAPIDGGADHSVKVDIVENPRPIPYDPCQIGVPMPGKICKIFVDVGDTVNEGDTLLATEAMKMGPTSKPPSPALLRDPHREGKQVQQGDLVIVLE
jgi:pyruvate carboxylase